MLKVTGVGFVQSPEGLRVAYRYATIDDKGNIISSNQRGSYIDDSAETAEFLAGIEATVLAHIEGA